MNDAKANSSNTRDLLSEFFYEVICRIVPGGVLLALYSYKNLLQGFASFQNASIVLGIAIFIAAWLIGVMVELLGFTPWALLIKGLARVFRRSRFASWAEKTLLPNRRVPVEESARRTFQKFCAEKVMFRGMALISVLTCVWKPNLVTPWSPWFGVVGGVLFLVAWAFAKVLEKEQVDQAGAS